MTTDQYIRHSCNGSNMCDEVVSVGCRSVGGTVDNDLTSDMWQWESHRVTESELLTTAAVCLNMLLSIRSLRTLILIIKRSRSRIFSRSRTLRTLKQHSRRHTAASSLQLLLSTTTTTSRLRRLGVRCRLVQHDDIGQRHGSSERPHEHWQCPHDGRQRVPLRLYGARPWQGRLQ